MGIDWYRMSPKAGTDRVELLRLVEQQASAFQGMPYYWATDPIETPDSYHETTRRQYEEQYFASSRALRNLLDFPPFNLDTSIPSDYPDLEPTCRVSPVTRNTIFPPGRRRDAYRTFLAQDLREQIVAWRGWITAVAEGAHEGYLVDLYLYEVTMLLFRHCQQLKDFADASLASTAKWASKPELSAVRERILTFPTPTVHPSPLEPAATASGQSTTSGGQLLVASLWQDIDELSALTRSWDTKVKGRWKLRCYQNHYWTFQQYFDQWKDAQLYSFLNWAERCSALDFGLFLDY